MVRYALFIKNLYVPYKSFLFFFRVFRFFVVVAVVVVDYGLNGNAEDTLLVLIKRDKKVPKRCPLCDPFLWSAR